MINDCYTTNAELYDDVTLYRKTLNIADTDIYPIFIAAIDTYSKIFVLRARNLFKPYKEIGRVTKHYV
jgi:hypothetical protein